MSSKTMWGLRRIGVILVISSAVVWLVFSWGFLGEPSGEQTREDESVRAYLMVTLEVDTYVRAWVKVNCTKWPDWGYLCTEEALMRGCPNGDAELKCLSDYYAWKDRMGVQ